MEKQEDQVIDEELVDKEVKKIAANRSEEEQGTLKNVFMDILVKGMSIMQAIGFPPAQLEVIYSYASELYSAGKYDDASALFFFISQLNPRDPRFTFGLAASFHKLKRYGDASVYYLMSTTVDRENPLPYFHAADCFIQLNQPEAAIVMLDNTLALSWNSPQHEKLKQQASALLEIVQQATGKTKQLE